MKTLRVHEILGAKKFQDIVLKIENLKYYIINSFFPDLPKKYEKRLARKLTKKLRNSDETTRKEVINNYRNQKMRFKKELVRKENRNYHFDMSSVDETINYFKWNKKVHERGMIKDIVMIILGIAAIFVGQGAILIAGAILAIFNSLCLLIDFECVNLQNYNLKRINQRYETLKMIETRKKKRELLSYCEATNVIATAFGQTNDIPKVENISEAITSIDQIRQIRNLLLQESIYSKYEKGSEYIGSTNGNVNIGGR